MRWLVSVVGLAVGLMTAVFAGVGTANSRQPADTKVGYGFNVAVWDVALVQDMGFNWIKVFNPPGNRLPVNVLIRLDANAGHLGDVDAFGDNLENIAQDAGDYIEAYEIGNEPNLDASYGWAAPPVAADYVTLLCEAYARIKAHDPDAQVVSAGLAPTGRVQGHWNGHPGHNGLFQDEREWLKEFIAAGGGDCTDGIGYHNYGFSADFDTPPDTNGGTPDTNCTNGFCFRGVEKIYEIMQANGLDDKEVWTTEFGWIVHPPDDCLDDPGWSGREWQLVSEQEQAENLAGAYGFAADNWPWLEAAFVFNLNFNTSGWYDHCEQMVYYSVEERPAEQALREMPKPPAETPVGELGVAPLTVTAVITPGQQPYTATYPLTLRNTGEMSFTYTTTQAATATLPLLVQGQPSGALAVGETAVITVGVSSNGRSPGVYTNTLTITATTGTAGAPVAVPVTLYIFNMRHDVYLPFVLNQN